MITIDFTDYERDARQFATPRRFRTKRAVMKWLMDGLYWTDGAERDHYADMIAQLDSGNALLFYWGKPSNMNVR